MLERQAAAQFHAHVVNLNTMHQERGNQAAHVLQRAIMLTLLHVLQAVTNVQQSLQILERLTHQLYLLVKHL